MKIQLIFRVNLFFTFLVVSGSICFEYSLVNIKNYLTNVAKVLEPWHEVENDGEFIGDGVNKIFIKVGTNSMIRLTQKCNGIGGSFVTLSSQQDQEVLNEAVAKYMKKGNVDAFNIVAYGFKYDEKKRLVLPGGYVLKLRGETDVNITDNFESYMSLSWSTYNKSTIEKGLLELDKNPPIQDNDKGFLLCQCNVQSDCFMRNYIVQSLSAFATVTEELEKTVENLKQMLFKCDKAEKKKYVFLLPTPKLYFKRKQKRLRDNLQSFKKLNTTINILKSELLNLMQNTTLKSPLFHRTSFTTATPTTSVSSMSTLEPEEIDQMTGLTEQMTGLTDLRQWQNIVLLSLAGITGLGIILAMFTGLLKFCIRRVRRNAEAQALIRSIAMRNAHRVRK